MPAPSYWSEWLALNDYLAAPLPGYLFGQISTHGWWYYYPVTFLLKTPLPVLILLGAVVVLMLVKRAWWRNLPVLLPPALLLLTLLVSPHDLGYRYLLPMLPFIFVACADVFAVALQRRWTTIVAGLLIGWQIFGTLRIYPYYFAFFNEAAGGSERGRYLLSDSNLDWGQDLVGLHDYVEQQHMTDLNLSYFGNTPPQVYGLAYVCSASSALCDARAGRVVAASFLSARSCAGNLCDQRGESDGWHLEQPVRFRVFSRA